MKNFIPRIISVFFLLSSVHFYCQEKTNDCKEIYGKWKTYYMQLPFGIDSKDKSETWVFNENGTLTVDEKMSRYTLDEDCSKFTIEGDLNFFSIKITGDTLFMSKRVLPHESYIFRLKRN
ncbi:hypothetical protein D0817_09200 [Flavobacterium cupreum]|uniref:Lipocalin-like domain-containing protein n=1 Tax=Flavobacterium cupreum TaxID=2133766 RepID=A0A434A8J0_9FLAO|nr:hypothetical protein [Flavobacterium cupreum]RUT70642.1 hypothetical protein D0817_09200 [Flavobacterium cupreum]